MAPFYPPSRLAEEGGMVASDQPPSPFPALLLQCPRPLAAALGGGRRAGLELEVEIQFGEASALHAAVAGRGGVVVEAQVADQPIAGGIGEVVPQVAVARQVDLGGQVAMAGRRDEEVNVRRPLAVAARRSSSSWVGPSLGQP